MLDGRAPLAFGWSARHQVRRTFRSALHLSPQHLILAQMVYKIHPLIAGPVITVRLSFRLLLSLPTRRDAILCHHHISAT
ncbi:protein of unknown function [Candidatus Promineifilum breve]|uniref:Uncharacterized protein n=1 Tax=Candidatus Promineifilum breve TaxID=1806508 RepID=A0A161KB02_9CHLR|nr:protein of unknown function [Candidatus Promineifilum breve]